MKLLSVYGALIFLLLCGFSLFKKADDKGGLPLSFLQKPVSFATEKPEEIQKQLASIAKTHSSQAVEWWILYKKATLFKETMPQLFCHNMQFLSKIELFPLKDYAYLHVYSHCQSDVKMDLNRFPEWMKKRAVQAWHQKSKKQKVGEEIKESAYYLYQLSQEKHEKEKHLITAIGQAKQSQDSRLKSWRKELLVVSPRYIANPTRREFLKVAHDFRQSRQWTKARIYYRKLLNSSYSSFKEKNESFKWMRWIYKARRDNKRHLIATQQWKNWLKRTMKTNKKAFHAYHNIFYLLARTQWTLNQSSKALNTLDQIEKELKGRFSLLKVYRMKALILEEQGKIKKALTFFEKALKEKAFDREVIDKTQWNYAWALQKIGLKDKSLSVLSDLAQQTESDYLPSRVLFWMGRLYEDKKQKEQALLTYKTLLKKDPLSYYGLLAHYKTGQVIRLKEEQNFLEAEQKEGYAVAEWLISLNEKKLALEFLQHKAKEYKKDPNKKAKKWSALFYYMAKAGSYFPLFKMAGDLPLEERTVFFQSYPSLIFPVIYKKEIEQASQLYKVEKEMIYGLIRQESAWNPKARSPADAFGLMQLRPFVARQVAKRQGIAYKNIYDLYKPKTNILLGTAFLKKLFKQYDSRFIITVAVYNAGRTAMRRWLKTIPLTDSLSFIEEIPYQETRTYVRLLIRNFIFYKLLLHPKKEVVFPEWLLRIQPTPPKAKPTPPKDAKPAQQAKVFSVNLNQTINKKNNQHRVRYFLPL